MSYDTGGAKWAKKIGRTNEPCPICGDEMTVIHGVRDALNPAVFVHLEDCPTCGKSAPFVGYDCPDCNATEAEFGIEVEEIAREQ